MKKALVGLALVATLLASGCGGSDLPPEVEEARREAVEVADEQYDAAVATAEAQYRNSLEKTQNRYDSAVATAEAKYYTDAVRKRHLDSAKESRDSSIEYAKAHYEEMLEHAESERVKRIEDAEERSAREAAVGPTPTPKVMTPSEARKWLRDHDATYTCDDSPVNVSYIYPDIQGEEFRGAIWVTSDSCWDW